MFLSASSADVNDGAQGEQVLAVTFPASFDLDPFAVVEDGPTHLGVAGAGLGWSPGVGTVRLLA